MEAQVGDRIFVILLDPLYESGMRDRSEYVDSAISYVAACDCVSEIFPQSFVDLTTGKWYTSSSKMEVLRIVPVVLKESSKTLN